MGVLWQIEVVCVFFVDDKKFAVLNFKLSDIEMGRLKMQFFSFNISEKRILLFLTIILSYLRAISKIV